MERLVASVVGFVAIIVASLLGPAYVTAIRNETGEPVIVEVKMASDTRAETFALKPGGVRVVGFSPDTDTSLSVGVRPRGAPMSINKLGYYTPGVLGSECDRVEIRSADDVTRDDCGPLFLLGALN